MDRCPSCGAAVAAGVAWCSQCFTPTVGSPVAGAAASLVPSGSPPGAFGRPLPAPPVTRATRWGKTPTTFGPLGRILCTLGLLLPLGLMLVGGLADPFTWVGAAIWVGVVMPMALRDVWKAGRISVR